MDKKILVAYFSASGSTKKVAETIAKEVHGDVFEIQSDPPYSNADLNWNDKKSRCVKEWKDKSSRPTIKSKIDDMNSYDIVFLGYPIWWEESPRIIYTFLESYDFSGKVIVPFSTSGGSVRGSKGTHLYGYCSKQTKWAQGKLLSSYVSESEIKKWIDGLELTK